MPGPTRRHFDPQPLLWLAISFACGILFSAQVRIDLVSSAVLSGVAMVLALSFRTRTPGTVLVLVGFIVAGTFAAGAERHSIRDDWIRVLLDSGQIPSGAVVEVEGLLAGRPEPAPEGDFLLVHADRIRYRTDEWNIAGNVRLFVPRTYHSDVSDGLKYGSRVRVACEIDREDRYLNPGVMSRREVLDRMGIDATGNLKSALLIEHLADESVFIPLAWVYDARAALIATFRANLSRPAAGVMIASLLGNRYFLDKETADVFREGGTFHILVISGLHITFIGGVVFALVRIFTRSRWNQFSIVNAVLWAYTLAVGADIPVVRAAIMFTIVSFSFVIHRNSSLLNSLGLCALILLVWRPSDLFNPSFQLTFVSVAAIVGCGFPLVKHLRSIGEWAPSQGTPFPPNVPAWLRRLCETLYWDRDKWIVESKRQVWSGNILKAPYLPARLREGFQTASRLLFEGILISTIVQLWMLPLSVVHFHRVSLASIVLNLWVGGFIALESFAAFFGALATLVSGLLADGFFGIAAVFNWLMLLLPTLVAEGGWASFRLPAYEGAARSVYWVYFVPLIVAASLVNGWDPFGLRVPTRRVRGLAIVSAAAAAILTTVIALHPFSAPVPDGRLSVEFLDVGQGDSIFITFPNGQTMLVDAGGRFDYRDDESDDGTFAPDVRGIGEAVVSEVLWAKGYSRIDHVVATHAHADHVGGLTDVAKNFTIGSVLVGAIPDQEPGLMPLDEVLRRRGIRVETIARGDILRFGDAAVEVLFPPTTVTGVSANDNSIVLRIVYGSRVVLITGDIEKSTESQLAESSVLRADVVKVPHHGSPTSSTQEFVDAVNATHAVISAPRRSPFGHPHPEVVRRWKDSGAHVMTTGVAGMITVSTNADDLVVYQFAK
jgi:competence protein ComEC